MVGKPKVDDSHAPMPMLIAPWTYFAELQERTGVTESTPESIVRFAMEDSSREVTITKHLITLGVKGGRCSL